MADSDNVQGMFCESCHKYRKRRDSAKGFCTSCLTFYCGTCLEYHDLFLPDHTQQGKYSMPMDFYFETCNRHPKEMIKFYCRSCEITVCTVCISGNHKQCSEVGHLSLLAKEFEHTLEFDSVEQSINSIETEVENVEKANQMDAAKVEQFSEHARNVLTAQKMEIMKMFGDIEADIDKYEADLKTEVKKENGEINQMKTNIINLKSDINNKKTSRQRCKLFLATQEARKELVCMKENLDTLKKHTRERQIPKCEYKPPRKKINSEMLGKVVITNPGKQWPAVSIFAKEVFGLFGSGHRRQNSAVNENVMSYIVALVRNVMKLSSDLDLVIYTVWLIGYFSMLALLLIMIS